MDVNPPIVIGMFRGPRRKAGERIEQINFEGKWLKQPLVVVGPSTLEAWIAFYRWSIGREPLPQEMVIARSPESHFYEVTTD